MQNFEPEKNLCYSMYPHNNVVYHTKALRIITVFSGLTLLWIIISMIIRPPKFEDSLGTAGSVFRILSLIIQFFIFAYTMSTKYKYAKNENPDEDYIKMWAKVTLVLLIIQFLFLIIMFILFFLLIIKFIENYEYDLDTVWMAVSRAIMLICLFITVWEIYLVILIFLEGEKPRIYKPTKTKVIKSTPVYTNTTAQNNIEYQEEGFEDDFMGMNVQGGKYIGDSSQQSEPTPQLGPKKVEGNEDDFFGPRLDQGDQYMDPNSKKDDGAQYYQTDNPNAGLNKQKKDDDQPL